MAKTILNSTKSTGGIIIPDFHMYCRIVIIKIA